LKAHSSFFQTTGPRTCLRKHARAFARHAGTDCFDVHGLTGSGERADARGCGGNPLRRAQGPLPAPHKAGGGSGGWEGGIGRRSEAEPSNTQLLARWVNGWVGHDHAYCGSAHIPSRVPCRAAARRGAIRVLLQKSPLDRTVHQSKAPHPCRASAVAQPCGECCCGPAAVGR
jgi:hypothetical protein